MPLYENSVIYKLVKKDDYDNENIYIGSTTNFRSRKNQHKLNSINPNRKEYNAGKYQYIREKDGFDSFVMIQIEPFPCNSKKELQSRERYWIETLQPKLNKSIPTRTKKEYNDANKEHQKLWKIKYREDNKELIKKYRENNKEHIKMIKKQYNEGNKEHIKDYNKQYNEINKEKAKHFYEDNKEKLSKQHKTYREKNKKNISEKAKLFYEINKEQISEKAKLFYENNKEKISEKARKKILCACGCEVCTDSFNKHKKSPKHQKLMLMKI